MGRLIEDIHIHAAAEEVFARIEATGTYGEWLPRCFREVDGVDGAFVATLALPLRAEAVRLEPAEVNAAMLHFRASDGGEAFDSLTWHLNTEGPREVHLELQAVYTPAGGFPGAILDVLLLRSYRRQALRDALWRLKYVLEGNTPPSEGDPA
ncbi:MAG: SRPBCC family protein [Chloroflexi bacterium]|nr:SRPBCC family protein [Chloroflexota bacterium]